MPALKANVQDRITYRYTKAGVELTHPSGVKVLELRAQVEARVVACDEKIAAAQEEKTRLATEVLAPIDAPEVQVVSK